MHLRRTLKTLAIHALGDLLYYRIWFRIRHGYWPSFSQPKTFNEKIWWIRLNSDLSACTPFACKICVRDYVRQVIGEQYLVPVFAILDDPNDICAEDLPPRFVCKPSHGSKMIFRMKNKTPEAVAELRKSASRWLKTDYGAMTGETFYSKCCKRLLIEEFLENHGEEPVEYKWMCYEGRPKFIQVHTNRFSGHRMTIMDLDWNVIPCSRGVPPNRSHIMKPVTFDKMAEIAADLSRPFPFARIDLYSIGDRVLFSEITFLPAAGRTPIRPVRFDALFGEDLPLIRDYFAYIRNRINVDSLERVACWQSLINEGRIRL